MQYRRKIADWTSTTTTTTRLQNLLIDVFTAETWSVRTSCWTYTTMWKYQTLVFLVSRQLTSWVGHTAVVRRTLHPRYCKASRTMVAVMTSGASELYSILWSVS